VILSTLLAPAYRKIWVKVRNNKQLEATHFENLKKDFNKWIAVADLNKIGVDRGAYLIKKIFCLNEIIRYERLQEDLNIICQRIGLEYRPELLPLFKNNYRPIGIKRGEFYTKDSQLKVKKHFSIEMEYFGYSFEDS
jgi:hypothetical protein